MFDGSWVASTQSGVSIVVLRSVAAIFVVGALVGCAAPPAATSDGGRARDGGSGLDASRADAAALPDAGMSRDAGTSDASASDAGRLADAGAFDAPPSTCHPALGAPCDDRTPCDVGFECQVGRCGPQGRPLCGGFAGATCDTAPYPVCLYYTSADFGPCLTRAERDCLCVRAPESFVCS